MWPEIFLTSIALSAIDPLQNCLKRRLQITLSVCPRNHLDLLCKPGSRKAAGLPAVCGQS
jgi:hypothetical protein